MLRLFVALALPESLKAELAGLVGGIPGAKWVPPANYHMTLRFIGEIQSWQADEVDHALATMNRVGLNLLLEHPRRLCACRPEWTVRSSLERKIVGPGSPRRFLTLARPTRLGPPQTPSWP